MVYTLGKRFRGKEWPGARGIRHSPFTLRPSPYTLAFTLVELSVVIVILGLLVAATMAGQELMKSARLKSIISEIEDYKVAVNNFRVQYEALPGDMINATSFWTTAQNGSTAVANGNGDGKIGAAATSGAAFSGVNLEPYYLWNHLTLSKFVPGTFLGNSTAIATVGTNVPASKYINLLGFSINYHAAPFGYADALTRNFPANYILAGATRTSSPVENYLAGNVLIPADASYIDSKIDDGTPKFGKVLSGDGPTYLAGSCLTGSAYLLTSATAACIMLISLD